MPIATLPSSRNVAHRRTAKKDSHQYRRLDGSLDSFGNLFGTTFAGGEANDGTLYELVHAASTITTLASFNGANGANPSGVIRDSSGNLYGTTSAGGADNAGTVFTIARGSRSIATLAAFNGANGSDPNAGVALDSAGDLFGTTRDGGIDDAGRVFEIPHARSAIIAVADFTGDNGARPSGGITLDSAGDLLGPTSFGNGTLFEIAHGSNTVATISVFDRSNGAIPTAALTIDSRGNLYGTTLSGGVANVGTVFELSTGSPMVATIHAAAHSGPFDGKPHPATGFVFGAGVSLGKPVFTYYLPSDKTFQHPLAGAPTQRGTYVFVARFNGNSTYLPTSTSGLFAIS